MAHIYNFLLFEYTEKKGILFTHLLYGRFYKLVSMGCSVSIFYISRTVGFCFSLGHVARCAPSRKTKAYGTIVENSSQANL